MTNSGPALGIISYNKMVTKGYVSKFWNQLCFTYLIILMDDAQNVNLWPIPKMSMLNIMVKTWWGMAIRPWILIIH